MRGPSSLTRNRQAAEIIDSYGLLVYGVVGRTSEPETLGLHLDPHWARVWIDRLWELQIAVLVVLCEPIIIIIID